MLGVPLGNINADMANFSLAIEDTPPVTISDGSIRIESAGIMLAFPLACLIAGLLAASFAAGRRLPGSDVAVMSGEDVWPAAPRPPLQQTNNNEYPE